MTPAEVLPAAARRFLAAHAVARLATADASGMPHVVPCCYALVGDRVYFVVDEKPKRTRTGLKRLRNLQVNPQVAFVVDDYDDDWDRLAFLLVQGEAAVVTVEAEFGEALEALRARYPQYGMMRLCFGVHPMVRITPRRCHLWRAQPQGGDLHDPCSQVSGTEPAGTAPWQRRRGP